MRLRKERGSRAGDKPADQSQEVLDTAITSVVQALGSRLGVFIYWDESHAKPGHAIPYGLNPALYEEMQPMLADLVTRLGRVQPFLPEEPGERERHDELPALKVDFPTPQGPLQVIALPIYADSKFFAALCLVQPLSQAGLFAPGPGSDKAVLPAHSGLDLEMRGLEEDDYNPATPAPTPYNLDETALVTRNARLLRQLVQEKQWWQAIVNFSADGILIVDKACNIIGFNPAFARLTGWTVEELRGQNCYEALKFSPRVGNFQCGISCPVRLTGYLNLPEEERRSEVVLTTKDGEKRDVELTYSVILSSHREILGGIIGARDITARKQAEELQSTFLSVISHELQTPISIIKGYAGLFADKPGDFSPEQLREKMQIVQEESERLSQLVENLLYASRLQAGGIEVERAPVDLVGLVKRVVQKMKDVSKQHSLVTRLPEALPAVMADYNKIQQVLVNLIENAIKYSPRGGPIVIEAEPTGDEVIVSVTDQGIGVPEQERQRIFERFSRLDSRYVRERKGAGLGLYISKAIIEAHGGRIWVEPAPADSSQSGSSGSRFRFSLPREEPASLPVLFGKV